MQQWYSMSDPTMEDALYEIVSMRLVEGLSRDRPIPDHSTILKFRHLLERHSLARKIFSEVSNWLTEAGVLIKESTLMDLTIVEAPTSTKKKRVNLSPRCIRRQKHTVALWLESPYRCRCPNGLDTHIYNNSC
jgi:IS5 family transposase